MMMMMMKKSTSPYLLTVWRGRYC